MPTEIEIRVMEMLSAIEIDPELAAAEILELGTGAVTVVSEAALGSYPGLRQKIRHNAVSLLGWIDHPQARESIAILVKDEHTDVAIRAARAAARSRNESAVVGLGQVLLRPESSPIAVAEALKALLSIDSPAASNAISKYESSSAHQVTHRDSAVVAEILATRRKN